MKEKISGRQAQNDFDPRVVRVVASFVLEKWLLQSVFGNLHLEGLVKDFVLPKIALQNFQLVNHILYMSMTWQKWEVPTPESEQYNPQECQNLFSMQP